MPVNYRAGAGALDAVKDAISFYMDLRQQKYDRDRQKNSDSRADRQLNIAEERANLDRQDKIDDNERASSQFMITNFGGAPLDAEGAGRLRKQGYGSAIEDDMSLPSRNPSMPVNPVPAFDQTGPQQMTPRGITQPMQTLERYSPSAPTGGQHIRIPESEKSRIAYYQAAERSTNDAANRASREKISDASLAVRRAQIRASLSNAQTAAAASRYGVDVRDATQRQALEEAILRNSAQIGNMDWDNMMAGGPLAIMRFMSPDGGLQLPQYTPLAPGHDAGPAAGGRMGATPYTTPGARRYTELP